MKIEFPLSSQVLAFNNDQSLSKNQQLCNKCFVSFFKMGNVRMVLELRNEKTKQNYNERKPVVIINIGLHKNIWSIFQLLY